MHPSEKSLTPPALADYALEAAPPTDHDAATCLEHPKPSQSQPLTFFQLPPEIRRMILEMAVVEPNPIKIPQVGYHAFVRSHPYPDPALSEFVLPQLFMTCRLLRDETVALFYGNNTFCATGWREWNLLLQFLEALPTDHRAMIRNIKVMVWEESSHERSFCRPLDPSGEFYCLFQSAYRGPGPIVEQVSYEPTAKACTTPFKRRDKQRVNNRSVYKTSMWAPFIDPTLPSCVKLLSEERLKMVTITVTPRHSMIPSRAWNRRYLSRWSNPTSVPVALENACREFVSASTQERMVRAQWSYPTGAYSDTSVEVLEELGWDVVCGTLEGTGHRCYGDAGLMLRMNVP